MIPIHPNDYPEPADSPLLPEAELGPDDFRLSGSVDGTHLDTLPLSAELRVEFEAAKMSTVGELVLHLEASDLATTAPHKWASIARALLAIGVVA